MLSSTVTTWGMQFSSSSSCHIGYSKEVSSDPNTAAALHKPEPAAPQAESKAQESNAESVAPPPKVDIATDLFNMLSMGGPVEIGSEGASPPDDNAWAGFQSAESASSVEKVGPTKPAETKVQSTSGIDDLFKDCTPAMPFSASGKPQKDVKNDIMSLFEKSNMVSPFSIHQQQLSMLAQQQSLLMAAAAKSGGGISLGPVNTTQQQTGSSSASQVQGSGNLPTQNWPNLGYQVPGVRMPVAGQNELHKFMQMGNTGPAQISGSAVPFASSSMYTMGQVSQMNGVSTNGVRKPPAASPVSSFVPTGLGKDYDFSSLTQGMFSKP
ncbi:hypothetical protein GIB67_031236 [Kingdonia uniflora]|uniref:ADP-ribosylation factor GTPase-activating protein AGD5 n=1 Tax=Kingdonia uniflora TaxID=39325 RepID=A0A7J7NKM1_9MAGN|nr:hypothetical protein GIB67_031236 [Kingdonia uniflora]